MHAGIFNYFFPKAAADGVISSCVIRQNQNIRAY